jgi:hypothetical protein
VILPGWEALGPRLEARRLPWLGRLLARSEAAGAAVKGLHAAIAATVAGEAAAVRRWAPGPLCASADGIDGDATAMIRLDPVHLEPAGDGLVVSPPGRLDRASAEALAGAVGDALDHDPLPRVGAPGRWYASRPGLADTRWREPEAAYGRNAYDVMPAGPGGGGLRRLMNEIQMVLHEHEVNRARAAAGLPEVNSLWPWGWPDREPAPPPVWPGHCYGDHPYARALTRLAGGSLAPGDAPAPAGAWPGLGLKICDEPWSALQAGDEAAAVRLLRRFDESWCEPLLRALQRRRLGTLRLVLGGREFRLTPAGAWRLWRRDAVAEEGA